MKTREEKNQYLREWREKKKAADPGYWKQNYAKHREYYIQKSCERFTENKSIVTQYYRNYYKIHKNKLAHLASNRKWRMSPHGKTYKCAERALRRAMGRRTISQHFKSEIAKIYKDRPEGHHVDHIYPLHHKLFCGLHVPWNLQYLPANENIRKSNKIPFSLS